MDPGVYDSLVQAMMSSQQPQQQPGAAAAQPGVSSHIAPLVAAMGDGQSAPVDSGPGNGGNRIQPLVAPTGGGGYVGVSAQPPPQSGPGEIQGLGQSLLGSMSDIPHHLTGIGQGINNLGSGVGHAIGTIARMASGGGGGMGGMGAGMMGKFGGGG